MKAQVAVEFILVFMFMMVVLIGAVVIAGQKSAETEAQRMDIEAMAVVYEAASAVNTAHTEGDGFKMDFALPGSIADNTYTVGMGSGSIWVVVQDRSYIEKILTSDITGEMHPGDNTVENRGGYIYVNP